MRDWERKSSNLGLGEARAPLLRGVSFELAKRAVVILANRPSDTIFSLVRPGRPRLVFGIIKCGPRKGGVFEALKRNPVGSVIECRFR